MTEPENAFDFETHKREAVTAYRERYGFYESLAATIKRILEEALERKRIQVHSVQARAKEPSSFAKKVAQPSETDSDRPKYTCPLQQITDLAGVRVITYFPGTLQEIDQLLRDEFHILERSDKSAELIEGDRFGYRSIHYLVKFTSRRSQLPEYASFYGAITEIQVRTILQHAWAEIEHDIQYKSVAVIPAEIRRRFMALAGMLELADREFQAIQNADKELTEEARSRVAEGQLSQVEITPDALKVFLDKRLGVDGRMRDFSYNWTARLLKKLGFLTLEQVEKCIRDYDDDQLSRIAFGGRLGQTARFEYMLLAGMGEHFLQRHFFSAESRYGSQLKQELELMKDAGVLVRGYDPLLDQPDTSSELNRASAPLVSPEGQTDTEAASSIRMPVNGED